MPLKCGNTESIPYFCPMALCKIWKRLHGNTVFRFKSFENHWQIGKPCYQNPAEKKMKISFCIITYLCCGLSLNKGFSLKAQYNSCLTFKRVRFWSTVYLVFGFVLFQTVVVFSQNWCILGIEMIFICFSTIRKSYMTGHLFCPFFCPYLDSTFKWTLFPWTWHFG